MRKTFIALLAATALSTPALAAHQGYYSAPDLSDNAVVFSSEGDLWRTSPRGGLATRLTTHPEVETAPRISPNGQYVAFTASYDGPLEIYVMPVRGGKPTRVTFEGGGVALRGWLNDDSLIYRTTNLPGTTPRLLRTVSRTSGTITDLPLADADEATLSGDGDTLFFTRYGLSIFSDNAVLYRGGRMAQLWSHKMGSRDEATRLMADFGAPIRHPMWHDGRIYFVTDKSGADNIWSVDESGQDARQHTARTQWQLKSPSLHNGQIVFQSGADIYRYDIATNSTSDAMSINLSSDSDYERRRWIEDPLNFLDTARMSPSGDAVTVLARGRVANAYKGERRRVEFNIPAEHRARSPIHSHDGKRVYMIVDGQTSGEIWRFPADGRTAGEKIKQSSNTYIWELYATPVENVILYSDKQGRLFKFNTDTQISTVMDVTQSGNDYAFGDFAWSSDKRYVAYSFFDDRDMSRVAIYDMETDTKHVVTTGKYGSFAPAFDADGDWLYFISNRNFNAFPRSPWGDRNMGPSFSKRGKLYALQLDPEAHFPFHPKDELALKADKKDDKDTEDKSDDAEKDDKDKDDKAKTKSIDFNNIQSRLWVVPVGPGNFGGMVASKDALFIRTSGNAPGIKKLEITHKDPKLGNFASGVRSLSISADRKTLFVQTGRGDKSKFLMLPAAKPFPKDTSDDAARVSDWKLAIDPGQEWEQMVLDAWRLHRDFAYDPDLRGVNWEAVRDHYVPMASRIGHRAEVNNLLAQMSAELGILHSQIRTGEVPEDEESGEPAYLGASVVPARGGLRIEHVYDGERDRPETLGPLRHPGVDIRKGDIITAIDGRDVRTHADFAKALSFKSGQQILVSYTRNNESHETILEPISRRSNNMLRYNDWVQSRRDAVADKTEGDIGYLHIRAMGGNDIASFARDFYEHYDKEGLIIDVRGNRGGNIDSWIIGTLLRQAWAYWKSPHGGPATTNMQQAFRGHLVILINEGTYSDGETFSAGVKALDIAPLIGTQTAGAGIWLSDRNRLVDGGQARVAEFAQYGIDGRWLAEGRGVAPDIEVSNPPMETYKGGDAQLDAAIRYLEEKITAEPIPELNPKPLPPLGEYGQDVE